MMKSSSSTKTNLNNNIPVMGAPKRLVSWSTIFVTCLTVLVFSILVKLGFWQLSRAEEKQAWQQELNERQNAEPLSFAQLIGLPIGARLTGYRLKVDVSPINTQIILLDNQVYQGTVGYLAYQAVQVKQGTPLLLVELGFVAGTMDRRQLPMVAPITSTQSLHGKLYQKSTNPLSEHLLAEPGNPLRVQNLNLTELGQLLQQEFAPAVLQPDRLLGNTLPRPWQPIPLGAQKHQGYALQWFSMAGAFLLLMLYLLIIKKKKTKKPN
ncbi:SURF1 family protein [Shewanella mesophila]|nr:SURF1 family protein [Shewanella mesophila]QYJ86296.1 SURF1 family protein [Shewanella mesophila]